MKGGEKKATCVGIKEAEISKLARLERLTKEPVQMRLLRRLERLAELNVVTNFCLER